MKKKKWSKPTVREFSPGEIQDAGRIERIIENKKRRAPWVVIGVVIGLIIAVALIYVWFASGGNLINF